MDNDQPSMYLEENLRRAFTYPEPDECFVAGLEERLLLSLATVPRSSVQEQELHPWLRFPWRKALQPALVVALVLLLIGLAALAMKLRPVPATPGVQPAGSSTPAISTPSLPGTPAPDRLETRIAIAYTTRTAEVAPEQTQVAETNTAYEQTLSVETHFTQTAITNELQATVTPQIFQSFPSPDGRWLAQVIQYRCTQVLPGLEYKHSYEKLKVGDWIVGAQLIYCGGMGAYGFGGLFWSADSRFFYYTEARDGWPDGGYPWVRPISRFDTTTGQSETLTYAVYSPDKSKLAGGQSADLVVWDVNSDQVVRFRGQSSKAEQISWVAWSADGLELVYLTQEVCQQSSPCPTRVIRVNLEEQSQVQLLGVTDPPMMHLDWDQPGRLTLYPADFSPGHWEYEFANGRLSYIPAPTPTYSATATLIPGEFAIQSSPRLVMDYDPHIWIDQSASGSPDIFANSLQARELDSCQAGSANPPGGMIARTRTSSLER